METTPIRVGSHFHRVFVGVGQLKKSDNSNSAWSTGVPFDSHLTNPWAPDDPRSHCHILSTTTEEDLAPIAVYAVAKHPTIHETSEYHIFAIKYSTEWIGCGITVGNTTCDCDAPFPPPFPMLDHQHAYYFGETPINILTTHGTVPQDYDLQPVFEYVLTHQQIVNKIEL
jgi:hypothetical protein